MPSNSTSVNAAGAAVAAAAQPADMQSPYIGLRPYSEKERSLFFGRDNDAKRLINKIFSSRLTLFYGPSGVGKSSLLLARVAPDLRDKRIGNSIVVIFDRWSEQAPDTAIKQQIIEALEDGPAAGDRQETLADLADRLNRRTNKSLVLVLDQFEQFLIIHGEHPDPLRTELAALLRAQVDVHVVISLREEFLAGLEVFAHDIVTIYDSKFRLAHLNRDGAREAIVQPAESFGVSVDPALIDRLLVDLKQQGATSSTAAITTGIELPFLQLICKGLWESRQPGEKSLSLEEYTSLGGRDGIIHRYLKNLTNSLPRSLQQDAADVLKWLAPRSGIKQAYEPAQLAELTGMSLERVTQILAHFERNRVLRDRLVGNSHWFELYHDAYTRILTPWIEERVADKKHRMALKRWLKRAALAVVVIGAMAWPVSRHISDMREAHLVEEGNIDQAITAVGRLEGTEEIAQLAATDYHFMQSADRTWKAISDKKDEAHRPEVAKLLKALETRFAQQHADMAVPRARYIRKESCLQPWATDVVPEAKEKTALLTIAVPANMRVDAAALRCAWLQLTSAKRTPVFHLPLPRRIAIEPRSEEQSIRVKLGDEAWDVPLLELAEPGAAILLEKDLSHPQLAWYFEKEKYGTIRVLDWSEPKQKFTVADAWIVPRWTLPLLRAAKIPVRPGEVGLASKIEFSLSKNQKALLTPDLVKLLIVKAREGAPVIVSEAEQARGGEDGIRPLILKVYDEFAKKNQGDALRTVVASFRDILDRLGEYPACEVREKPTPSTDRPSYVCHDDDAAAKAVVDGLRVRNTVAQIGASPRSPQQKVERRQTDQSSRFLAGDTFKAMNAYDIEEKAVPDTERPLLVFYGADLAHCFVNEQAKDGLSSQLQTGMNKLREALFKKYGALMPKSTWIEMEDSTDQLIVQLHGEFLGENAKPDAQGTTCVQEVVDAIGTRIDSTSSMWVSAQVVENALVALGGSQRWLRDTYSLTDLKLLLRGVLARENAASGSFNAARGLRDLPGLLASLPFWAQWCEQPGNIETNITECLVSGLRDTQRARFVSVPPAASNGDGTVGRKVEMAVAELIAATPDAASNAYRQFAGALTDDAQAVRREFLVVFASQILRRQAHRVEQRCTLRPGSFLSAPSGVENVEIDDFFEAAAMAKSAEVWQALRVCRIRGLKDDKDQEDKAADLTALLSHASRTDWKADDAAAAAVLALEAFHQGRQLPDTELDAAKTLIARAFRMWSGAESKGKAEAVFTEANTICEKAQVSRACWSVLKEALDAYEGPSSLIPLLLGLDLVSFFSSPNEVDRAFGLLRRAEMHLGEQQPEDERTRLSAWIRFATASAYLVLARNGDRGAAEKGTELLSSLVDKTNGKQRKNWPSIDTARIRLAQLAGNPRDVQAILDGIPPGDDANIESYRMWQLVAAGQLAEARRSLERSRIDGDGRLVSDIMIKFLEQVPASALELKVRQVVANRHPYSDYMRLMLYVLKAREDEPAARQELEKRWVDIVKQKETAAGTWNSRVERGEDVQVWQEMLVGYFLGHASREDLLAWAANPEHPDAMTETPVEYRGELHFYDAQLQSVTGDQATRRERVMRSLNEVRSSGPFDLNEYRMALYQLRILEESR